MEYEMNILFLFSIFLLVCYSLSKRKRLDRNYTSINISELSITRDVNWQKMIGIRNFYIKTTNCFILRGGLSVAKRNRHVI